MRLERKTKKMSLNQTLVKAVDNVVQLYIERVSQEFNLDKNELMFLWDGKAAPVQRVDCNNEGEDRSDVDHSLLSKCSKAELVELCKAKGVRYSGTKVVLIEALTGQKLASPPKKATPKSKKETKKEKVVATPVAKKLTAKIPIVPIRRNQFGNFEHPETSFVFNNKTQKVVGKQNDDGSVEPLTKTDIDICHKFKFMYELPENLDQKMGLDDVVVDELDEDERGEEIVVEDDDEEMVEEDEELLDDDFEEELIVDDDDVEYEEYYEEDE